MLGRVVFGYFVQLSGSGCAFRYQEPLDLCTHRYELHVARRPACGSHWACDSRLACPKDLVPPCFFFILLRQILMTPWFTFGPSSLTYTLFIDIFSFEIKHCILEYPTHFLL